MSNFSPAAFAAAKRYAKEHSGKQAMFDTFYPIGTIYATDDDSFDPNVSWGGTWVIIAKDRVLWGVDKNTNAGKELAQQLPNIKGELTNLNARGSSSSSIGKKGAFADTGTGSGSIGCGSPSGSKLNNIKFNANKSDSVYQDDAVVRPNSYTVHYWKRTK